MRKDKIVKIVILNFGIAAVNIILFSPGLLHLALGGESILGTALRVTAVFMSIMIFIYGNYRLLTVKEKIIQVSKLETKEDCIFALRQSYGKKTFEKDIYIILEQIERQQKKKEAINEVLLQRFSSTEMSYSKFRAAIDDVEKIFYVNIKSIINKLNAFDEEEYRSFLKENGQNELSVQLMNTKMKIYDEYISFVKNSIEDNEQIILKLDMLLLELSRFNSLEDGEIEKMNAMVEIDELIDKTKLYR